MFAFVIAATLLAAPPATSDDGGNPEPTPAISIPPVDVGPAGIGQSPVGDFDTSLSFDAGYTWQFRTDLNNGGTVSHGRTHTDGNFRLKVLDNVDLVLGWGYQYDQWSFKDSTRWWTDINTVQLDLGFRWRIDQHWSIFGGGQVLWAVERGGSWSDGVIGGGAGGFSYAFSPDLIIGGGVGVRSQLEDDALIYPIVVLNWQITERLSIDTRLTTGWANQSGAELVYALAEDLDLGLAVVFDYERFRLDDTGPLPGGVGTTETLPISVFLSWEPIPDVSVTVFAGATVYGRVKATNAASQDIYASNYDPAAVLGIQGGIRF